ncbi:MAG: Phosphoglycerate kinase [Syntrophorhabdus sp. PtaU1.Bin058]|nr:MAG: Phosphoglycerate kinase [Syntrophorhabdus sp. PtaU1.Bin058]
MKSIDQVDINGKRVLIRVDFNVPLDENGNVTDDTRIKAHFPTINYCLDRNAKVVLMSHMGRPKGVRVDKLSLKPVADRLSKLMGRGITFTDDCIGEKVEAAVAAMNEGDIVLLENLRFHIGDEKNDGEFARALARLCDVYVDDAFAVSHRKAASNTAITEFVKVCAAGFLLKNEIDYFQKAMGNPERPLAAIIGGAKVSDKIGVLENLIEKVDRLVVGGGMAFTFLNALGYEIGNSLCEKEMLDKARTIMDKAKAKNVKLCLPVDCIVAEKASADAETKVCKVEEIPKDGIGLDIGPATITLFSDSLKDAKTIVWNGPMGMFEIDKFSKGTYAVASSVAASGALSIIGGGDTDSAVHRAGVSSRISYISTGGGAFLELLEGKTMPAVEALEKCGG